MQNVKRFLKLPLLMKCEERCEQYILFEASEEEENAFTKTFIFWPSLPCSTHSIPKLGVGRSLLYSDWKFLWSFYSYYDNISY